MVSLKKIFPKSYSDLKQRFGVYTVLAFIALVSLTLILMGNGSFIEKVVINGNIIYSKLVQSTSTGIPVEFADIASSVVNIVLYFLLWLFELYLILMISTSLILSSIRSKMKLSNRFWIYSLIGSALGGLAISWFFRPIYLQLFLFYSLFIFSIVYLIPFIRKNSVLIFETMKVLWTKVLRLELSYYIVLLLLLLVKIFFIKQLLYDSLKLLFNIIDLIILVLFLHIFSHSVTYTFSKLSVKETKKKIKTKVKKVKFGQLLKYSLGTKSCYLISLVFVSIIILTLLLIALLSLIPYTGVLSSLILYLEFSYGIIYLAKVLTEANK